MRHAPADPRRSALPAGFRLALEPQTSFWSSGRLAAGGAPWKVLRFTDAALPFLAELRRAGVRGAVVSDALSRALGRRLIDHGLAHPVLPPRRGPHLVTVVVPAFERVDLLARCLAAMRDLNVVVVDDGSADPRPVRQIAEAYGARLVRHPGNRGPAAARNTGIRLIRTPFVAFIDSDCVPEPGWLDLLMPHFDDPRVGAVAPRVRPEAGDGGLLARHEAARSALDMGARAALVRPGGRLGFVPSAALLVRATALDDVLFDEDLRLGEDVDFVWRLIDRGWNIRYEPRATVGHESRLRPLSWARRRFEYGTSAADLARRHRSRLAPVRPSAWNLAALACLVYGRPVTAALVAGTATALLARRLSAAGGGRPMAAAIVGKGITADALAIGHALRREWWPAGLLALATVHRSRPARAATLAMLAPIALEWLRHRPDVDPARYAALRLLEDAAYGSGVIVSGVRARSAAPLLPEIRLPWLPAPAAARGRLAGDRPAADRG